MVRVFSQYVSLKTLFLMSVETVLLLASLLCAVRLRFWNAPEDLAMYVVYPEFAIQCAVVLAVCLACFYVNDLYDAQIGFGAIERALRIEQSIGSASLILGILCFLFPGLLVSRGVLLIAMLLASALMVLFRNALDRAWKLTAPVQHGIILGTGALGLRLAREIARRSDLSIRLAGFVSVAADPQEDEIAGVPVLGSSRQLEAIARERGISRIIVALEDRRGVLPTRELVSLRVRGIYIDDAATALSALTGRISLDAVRPSWFVFSEGFRRSPVQALFKRIFDVLFGFVGLVLSLPIMAAVALAIRLESKGPIIYRQTRVGRAQRNFELLKFRSMAVNAEAGTGARWATKNDPRVTRVGRFIRKYRLDELPQFINVLRGDMGFVGPRPERPEFVEELRKTIAYYDERHSVRPGVTGWAQVRYAYGNTVEDAANKLEYDLFYLKNMSITFDLAIIFDTVRIVIGGHGGL